MPQFKALKWQAWILENKPKIQTLYLAGVSGIQIAQQLAVPSSLIYKVVSDFKITRSAKQAALQKKEPAWLTTQRCKQDQFRNKVRELAERGFSNAEISEILGEGKFFVGKLANGVQALPAEIRQTKKSARKFVALTAEQEAEVLLLFSSGKNKKEIAKALRLPYEHVMRLTRDKHSSGKRETFPLQAAEKVPEILDKWLCGWTVPQLTAHYGFHVYNYIKHVIRPSKRPHKWKRGLLRAVIARHPDLDDSYQDYGRLVRLASNIVYQWFGSKVDPNKLRGRHWHLDHNLSISAAFSQGLPVAVVAHPANLSMLPSAENIKKGPGCSISLECLRARIVLFESTCSEQDIRALSALWDEFPETQTRPSFDLLRRTVDGLDSK